MSTKPLALAIALVLTLGASGCAERREGATVASQDVTTAPEKDDRARRDEKKEDVQDKGKDYRSPLASNTTRPSPMPEVAKPVTAPPPPRSPVASPKEMETRNAPTEVGVLAADAVGRAAQKLAKPASIGIAGARQSAQAQPIQAPTPGYTQVENTEKYQDHADNPVQRTAENPVSTFSIDVDTGSYSNIRRMLRGGALPPVDAVRAEEMINYFDFAYTPPATPATPFSVTTEISAAPWNAQHQLLLVGIKGYEVPKAQIPASNLVFLIDTSGSMDSPDKLPLLREAFKQMTAQLREQDRVSIVVYAGSAGLVLPPTPGNEHERIVAALDQLSAGGSTNGGAGIGLAYAMAEKAFIKGGVNRVILATDGDFNVGTTDTEALKTVIADKRRSGVALTTLGFGQGNYNDEMAEQLADIGNGNHAYIDSLNEAHKVLVEELSSTMLTIAKDVKIQIEFNPDQVTEYRLIGYENRALRREDFNNDKIDAGEIGAGHDVTALYELTLKDSKATSVDPLRYAAGPVGKSDSSDELAFLRLRYKHPDQDRSELIEQAIRTGQIKATASDRLRFASAVAAFADALRGGTHLGDMDFSRIASLARDAKLADPYGYRAEFVELVDAAGKLQTPNVRTDVAISR
ncbi:MAG: VWA domain-containing protein [Tahibacter sp.]